MPSTAKSCCFGSKKWKATYSAIRSTNEGMNGYIKDPTREAIAEPGRRRVHGRAAQSVFVALLLVGANLRKIQTFLWLEGLKRTGKVLRRPRRRRTRPVQAWRPEAPMAFSGNDPDPPLIA